MGNTPSLTLSLIYAIARVLFSRDGPPASGRLYMSFIVYVDHQQQIIYQKAVDVFDDVQSWDAIHQIRELEGFRELPMIFDFTSVRRMNVSCSHLEYIGFRIKTEIPVCLRALVVSERNRELLETFVAYSTGAFKSMELFDTVEDAYHWIKAMPNRLEDVMQQVQRSLENQPLRIPSSP